ncbi:MAG: alkaline phosphatase [Gemmatimonadota bacterium]
MMGRKLLLLAALLSAGGTGRRPAPATPPPSEVAEAATPAYATPDVPAPQVPFDPAAPGLLGPMVGHTTDDAVTFWIRAPGAARLRAVIAKPGGGIEDEETALNPDGTGVATVDGLEAGTRYTARFQLDGRPLGADRAATFTTFAPPGEPTRLRIALVSCARTAWDSLQPIWTAVAADRPDIVLWLGDNNYFEAHGDSVPGDWESPVTMAGQYAALRGLPTLQPLLRQAAQYAIWDDHDYADGAPDRRFPLRDAVARLFESFWANPSYGADGPDGIYSRFEAGDVEVFLLDGRYWRDPEETTEGPGKSLLGAGQKEWLKERLAASDARLKIVALGIQVLADYHEYDGYHHFAHERDELLDWIRDRRIGGVVFVSGDRHLSELMRWERPGSYPLYELTASPAANRFFPDGLKQPNPIRVAGYSAGPNYGLLDIDTRADPATIVFRIKDIAGVEVLTQAVPLDELQDTVPR